MRGVQYIHPYQGGKPKDGLPGTWSHCGNMRPHEKHTHTVTFNEGNYPSVVCLGTPTSVSGRSFSEVAGPYARLAEEERGVSSRISRISRINVLKAQLASMQEELTQLERFPSDRFEVGTAVLFDKVFEDSDQAFHYAAVKATPEMWYISGMAVEIGADRRGYSNRVNWEKLCYFMRDAENVRVVYQDDGQPLLSTMDYVEAPKVPDVDDPNNDH